MNKTIHPAGDDHVVWYITAPTGVLVRTLRDDTGQPVPGLSADFPLRSAGLAGRVAAAIVGTLQDGGTVAEAREAVTVYLSRLVGQVEADNPHAPQAVLDLLAVRARFAAPEPVDLRTAAERAWDAQLAAVMSESCPRRRRAARDYLKAVL